MLLFRRGLVLVGIICFGLLVFTSVSSTSAHAKTIKLKIAHEMPENHPYHLGCIKFGEILAQKTAGRIEVVIYPNGQLGRQIQLAEMVAANQLDICLVWQGILEGYDPDVGVISLPFIFDDWEHAWRVIDGSLGKKIFKPVEKTGIKVITVFNNGLYNIVSCIPVQNPEDMKGVNLRVQPSAVFVEAGEMLGAVVKPMAFGEVYSALQLGTVDAEIQGPINVRKSKHYEVADYTCNNQMAFLLEPVLMSTERFYSFSEEDQDFIIESAHKAAIWQRQIAEEADVVDTKFLKENGMNYYEPDRGVWKAAMIPIYDKHPEWKDIIHGINVLSGKLKRN